MEVSARMRSNWRFFPWAVVAGMGVVIAVNVTMTVLAVRSFPGNVGSDGFTLSNRYNQVMQSARTDQGRGWSVIADLADDRPRVVTRGRDGAPLGDARVQVSARRPLGSDARIPLAMSVQGAGVHVSADGLPAPGQWDLTIAVTAHGETLTTTQRVVRK